MEKSYNYSDVYLVPNYSELKSRAEADISVDFLARKFRAPFLPANMSSVINEDIAKWLSENDYFYIMHRFGDNMKFLKKANEENWKTISISVGVKLEDYDLLRQIVEKQLKIDYITIDIAQGHSILMKNMIEFIQDCFNDYLYIPRIIAGNVCTPEAVGDLVKWGADAIKIGIAGGSVCSTKNMTGFHIPMFSCVQNCKLTYKIWKEKHLENYGDCPIPIIADGAIRENGDVSKGLVAGAKMVMAGSIFAGCIDAPGEDIFDKNELDYLAQSIKKVRNSNLTTAEEFAKKEMIPIKKKYFGSASAKQKGNKSHVEGFEVEIPCNGLTYAEKYQELEDSLKSAVSYAGGKDLSTFNNVKYIVTK